MCSIGHYRGPDNLLLIMWSPPSQLRGMPMSEFEASSFVFVGYGLASHSRRCGRISGFKFFADGWKMSGLTSHTFPSISVVDSYEVSNPGGLRPDWRGREGFVAKEHNVHRTFWKIWTFKFSIVKVCLTVGCLLLSDDQRCNLLFYRLKSGLFWWTT